MEGASQDPASERTQDTGLDPGVSTLPLTSGPWMSHFKDHFTDPTVAQRTVVLDQIIQGLQPTP